MNTRTLHESASRPIELLSRRRLLRRVMFSAAWVLVLGALLSLPSLPLLAAEATHSAARLDDAVVKRIDGVFAEWDNTRSPGCVVGVSRGGQVVFARGYGMSNLEHDVPNTPESIFHIASISKQFTAAAIALLVADGKLSWSDDIRRYVPELPDYGHTITLAHLAHHTSGLRDQWDLLEMAGWRDDACCSAHRRTDCPIPKWLNTKPTFAGNEQSELPMRAVGI